MGFRAKRAAAVVPKSRAITPGAYHANPESNSGLARPPISVFLKNAYGDTRAPVARCVIAKSADRPFVGRGELGTPRSRSKRPWLPSKRSADSAAFSASTRRASSPGTGCSCSATLHSRGAAGEVAPSFRVPARGPASPGARFAPPERRSGGRDPPRGETSRVGLDSAKGWDPAKAGPYNPRQPQAVRVEWAPGRRTR